MVWYSHAGGSKDIYVALFNLSDQPANVTADLAALGLHGKASARDLWKKQDVGMYKTSFSQLINKHGAVLFRLSPTK
jgi:hypothetical protein